MCEKNESIEALKWQESTLNVVVEGNVSDVVNNVEKLTNPLEDLKLSNHVKANSLLSWIKSNELNESWYKKALLEWNFKLVEDGIMILKDVFDLQDQYIPENKWSHNSWINNEKWRTFFSFDASQKYLKSLWKTTVLDWSKYVDFLPGSDENKIDFLLNVLWLSLWGYRNSSYWNHFAEWVSAYYWTSNQKEDSDHSYYMSFNSESINANNFFYKSHQFALRCIKNK